MIIYFSGTGNSRHIARLLAEQLQDNLIDATKMIRQGIAADFVGDRPYIFVAPTYAWRLPRLFAEWIKRGRFDGCRSAYVFLTCGSGVGNAAASARRDLAEAGLQLCGLVKVVMPENYLAMFPVPNEAKSARIVAKAEAQVRVLVPRLAAGEDIGTPFVWPWSWLATGLVNSFFYKFIIGDDGFWLHEDKCIGCGLCEQVCVKNNIRIEDGRPVWQGDCTHCMACICRCPREAIEYKKASSKRRRYYLP